MGGYAKGSGLVTYLLAPLGVCYIPAGFFVIVAALRDPVKNILWLQFAIAVAVLTVIAIG
jgi:hypothetical protein